MSVWVFDHAPEGNLGICRRCGKRRGVHLGKLARWLWKDRHW